MDADHGVLAEADPQTLTRRGGLVPLSARVDAQASVLDDAGRLWVLDGATGDLVWLEHGRRHARPAASTPGAGLLTLAGGAPVLVDTAQRSATVLDPATGEAGRRVALDLRPGDRIQVSGAPRAARLYVATSRGVLEVCDLTGSGCGTAVQLDTEARELGAAVETGGRVFVPDYATGRVWVVDIHGWQVLAQPEVVDPNTRFQLVSRDGVVFFNDPNGVRAGVIRLDGGFKSVDKYDPANPGQGLANPPAAEDRKPGPAESKPPTRNPAPPPEDRKPGPAESKPPTRNPAPPSKDRSPAPGQSIPAGPDRPGSAPSTSPAPQQPGQQPTQPGPGRSSSSAPPVQINPPPPPIQIAVSSANLLVGQPVTLQVADRPPATRPVPIAARWHFGDGNSATGLTVGHTWAAAGTY